MSVNKVILVGNVGKDPETRYLDEQTAISKFPLATSETYKNRSGERVSTTEWHNVVLWRGLAQVAEKYVKKGSQIYIEGRIKTRSYDDADGNRKYITEIVGDQMQLLGKRPGDDSEEGYQQGQASQQASSGASTGASQASPAPSQTTQASQTPSQGQKGPGSNSGGSGIQGGDSQDTQDDSMDPFDAGDGPDDLPF